MGTSYGEDWKIMVDALRMDGRRFESPAEGVVWISHGSRRIKIEISNAQCFVEVRSLECCRKIAGSSEQMLSAMAKLGIIRLESLIASAFVNRGYEKALKIKRWYEKIKV